MKPVTDMTSCNGENTERMRGLLELCPWLKFGGGRTCLYVGCMPTRQDFLSELLAWGWLVELLEVYAPYVTELAQIDGVRGVHIGDVRTAKPGWYDLVFWWHGVEHVTSADAEVALANCELIARQSVVLGMPYGQTGSGAADDPNRANEHLSAWTGPDIGRFGYAWNVTTVGNENITACKLMGDKR